VIASNYRATLLCAVCEQNTLTERRRSLTELLVQLLKERDQREAELRHRLVSIDCHSAMSRAVLDLLLGTLAGTRFCRIWKANPAGAGAGAGFHHIISHHKVFNFKYILHSLTM